MYFSRAACSRSREGKCGIASDWCRQLARGLSQKSLERITDVVTPWEHGVGSHGVLASRGTFFGVVASCGSRPLNVTRRILTYNISPAQSGHPVQQVAIFLRLASVKVQSGCAADWRPPRSGVRKMTDDLATRRGASDPATVASKGGRARPREDVGVLAHKCCAQV